MHSLRNDIDIMWIHRILSTILHNCIPNNFVTLVLLLIFISLTSLGMVMQYSIGGGAMHPYAIHHLTMLFFAILLMSIINAISAERILHHAYHIYIISILTLALVLIFGKTAMGATRWISLLGFTIQPSELVKISVILALGRFFNDITDKKIYSISYVILASSLAMLPVLLILLQPNLGTASIISFITIAIFFTIGIRIWKFTVLAITIILTIPLTWQYLLHDYQKQRIMMFLYPDSDPLGAGYNLLQSQIAIGSGGMWGKGFLAGTQSQLKFLPEKHTDFIFTVLCEEFGFVSAIITISLYLIIINIALFYSTKSKDKASIVILIGLSSLFFCHLVINIGMITGILPIVGVPLPFLSYGGSNLITSSIALGLIIKFIPTSNEQY